MIELKCCDATMDEQETTISFGRKDDRASVYCNDSTILTKIAKALNAQGSSWVLEETIMSKDGVTPSGYKFSCPKAMIKFKAKGRNLTEEQKEALKVRFAKAKGINPDEVVDLEEEEEE